MPFVRPSHSVALSKLCKRIFIIGCHGTLAYRDKISYLWVRFFTSNKGVKEGYLLKRRYFDAIGSYTVKTVADRYSHTAYRKALVMGSLDLSTSMTFKASTTLNP